MRSLAAALLVVALPALGQEPLAGFGWLAGLAGSCWKGDHPDGKTSDTQCYQTQYGRLLRGTIRIEGGPAVYEGDSVYAWDAKAGRIRYVQWSSAGNLTPGGEAHYEGETLLFPDRARPDGQVPGRFAWTKIDADTYRVARQRREPQGEWKEAFAVTYRRVR